MKESIKQEVLQRMLPLLDNAQAKALEQTLETVLCKYMEGKPDENEISSQELLQKFLEAKRIEGCSEKTLTYYQNTINRMLTETGKEVTHIMTEDLRSYLTDYQKQNNLSRVTITSRIFRTFFWGSPGQVLLCLKSGHHGRLSRTHGPDVYFCFW